MRIVLVDDERLIVEGLKKIIGRKYPEMEISAFTGPEDALNEMKARLPELLITDIRMPGMTGLELIAACRKLGLKHYAVLTGLDDVPLLQESIRLRVSDYLIKPVNKEELFALIDRTMEQLALSDCRETDDLAEGFTAGALGDEEVFLALKSKALKSDLPPKALEGFLRAAGREVPFWEVCALTEALLRADTAPSAFITRLREAPRVKPINSPEVRQTVAEMREGFRENITLAGMAAKAYLQPNYFTTLFHKETGRGFVQYLNQLRIEAACRKMLEEPGLSLRDVGQDCGFPSPRYFFSTFKKLTGLTPGAFREAWTDRP